MTHKTKGIVLRTVKYGETSLVVTMLTELFGIQTYMVNGVRTSSKGGSKAALYQPAMLLELEVYHNGQKPMQRIKEAGRVILFHNLFINVVRHSIALFLVELINKISKQPENNPDMFQFAEDVLVKLDSCSDRAAANIPLYFALHLSYFHGFRISLPQAGSQSRFIDLAEGSFTEYQPAHSYYISGEDVAITSEILKVMQVEELSEIRLNSEKRKNLLLQYMDYYRLHIQDFGTMKTLSVLHEILG